MSRTTLYVVDMQPGYGGSFNVIDEVIREINLAKRRNDIVAFVTLMQDAYGKTHPQLLEAARSNGYQKVLETTKVSGDGSREFIAMMEAAKTPINRVRVCGVNRSACVMNTVTGLIKVLKPESKIELVCDATSDGMVAKGFHQWDRKGYTEQEYAKMAEEGKIKLLRA